MVQLLPYLQEKTLHTIFEHLPVGIACIDLTGRWLFINSKFCDILHYSKQELEQLTYQDIVFAEDRARDREQMQRFLNKEIASAIFEKCYLCKDGTPVWVQLTIVPMFVEEQHSSCCMIIAEDIQFWKQREYEKEAPLLHKVQSREQADELNEQMQILQIITNHALTNLSLDDLFRAVLGRIRTILGADNIAVLLLDNERAFLTIRAVDGIEEAVAKDVRVPLGQGFAGTVAAQCKPVIVEPYTDIKIITPILREQLQSFLGVPLLVNNEAIGVIHIGTKYYRAFTQQDIDLFERVADRLAIAIERSLLREQAQQTMQEAAQHLKYVERMNQTLQRFVSIVGHEFRTALTTILGFSELLLNPYTEQGEVQDYAKDILTDAQRLLRLVDDLLNVDRMQQGKMKLSLRKEQVDIVTLLHEQIEHTRQITHVHTFSPALPSSSLLIEGDPDKLKQVLINLLSNAIKYSPDGGTIQIQCIQEGLNVHISIQDEGIGIPDEALEHIFEPYNRVQSPETRYIGGTGLGLSITKYIIELHGGTIRVESVLGQGTTVHVLLPHFRQ